MNVLYCLEMSKDITSEVIKIALAVKQRTLLFREIALLLLSSNSEDQAISFKFWRIYCIDVYN